MSDLPLREIAIRQRLKDDYPHYAERCLKIRTKGAAIEPFRLNRAQTLLHEKAEDQIRRTGRVRAILLKGRQQGASTYIEGRFYHLVSHRRGVRAHILTHEQDATDTLFEMVERFHQNCPELVRPHAGASNAKELVFDRLDSGYSLGTAGKKETGRSKTIQLFHGSEVAFWPNAESHARGVLQTVPNEPGTELWLESTGNGEGGYFHEQWQQAVKGTGFLQPIFLPWFWQSEYRLPVPPDFTPDAEESELIALHGLDPGQLVWRRIKIVEFSGNAAQFKKEYPCVPEEAFQADTADSAIPSSLVRAAIGRDVRAAEVRPNWGVDCARYGDDLSALAKRRGNVLLETVKSWHGLDTMQLAGTVFNEYRETPGDLLPAAICVDSIGIGAGVADRLREMLSNTATVVVDVNVSESPAVQDRYVRLRDELWFEAREWFEARNSSMPDDPALIAELTGVKYTYTSAAKRQVESKAAMKKRGMPSPDRADAFIMTFARPDRGGRHGGSFEPEVG